MCSIWQSKNRVLFWLFIISQFCVRKFNRQRLFDYIIVRFVRYVGIHWLLSIAFGTENHDRFFMSAFFVGSRLSWSLDT